MKENQMPDNTTQLKIVESTLSKVYCVQGTENMQIIAEYPAPVPLISVVHDRIHSREAAVNISVGNEDCTVEWADLPLLIDLLRVALQDYDRVRMLKPRISKGE